jgi:hypothetical protein
VQRTLANAIPAAHIVAVSPLSFRIADIRVIQLEKIVRAKVSIFCLIFLVCAIAAIATASQTAAQRRQRIPAKKTTPRQEPTPEPTPNRTPLSTPEQTPEPSAEVDQQEVLKITTDLVTVPVIVTSAEGIYVSDLRKEEFSVAEDGVKQDPAFFATVSAPFHVVLLLDTSASTQEKLGLIRRAAIAFVEQLQSGDRVKVISFDDQVRDLNDFTNDRAALRGAINKTESGAGTKLYDAFELALSSIRTIQGRKAIVLFSDGVDYHSDRASFDGTLRGLDEEGVIVYPIRYETRAETERIARQQADDQTPQLPTLGTIRTPPSGTTAPTFPSDDPDTIPTSGRSGKTGPLGLPSAAEILRRRQGRNPDAGPYPSPDRPPPNPDPNDPRTLPGSRVPSGRGPSSRADDSISAMLDQLYLTADTYLNELASKSGGRLVRADTLSSLPEAFAKIAAELRTQYAIGYYPTNKMRDGQYRKIKITSTRKNVLVRARPGYRAPSGG